MEPIFAKLLEYSVVAAILAFIAWTLWKELKAVQRQQRAEARAIGERMENDAGRCQDALDSAVGRIRLLEDARHNDMREDKLALVRVLDRTASALETNAIAFKTLVDERREGSGQHPTRTH